MDTDTVSAGASAEKPPRWNIVSVAVPLAAAAVGVVQATGVSSGGNMGVAMGAAFAFVAFAVVGCAIGLVAALIAVVRNERMAWLSVLGLLGNGAVIVPIVFFLLKG